MTELIDLTPPFKAGPNLQLAYSEEFRLVLTVQRSPEMDAALKLGKMRKLGYLWVGESEK